jgi:hypothetical protein
VAVLAFREHFLEIIQFDHLKRKPSELTGIIDPIPSMVAVECIAALNRAAKIATQMANIELSTYQRLMAEYVGAVFLPHRDRAFFP